MKPANVFEKRIAAMLSVNEIKFLISLLKHVKERKVFWGNPVYFNKMFDKCMTGLNGALIAEKKKLMKLFKPS